MRRLLTMLTLSIATAVAAYGATSPIYVNSAPLISPPAIPPQIDATAFMNQSTFTVNGGAASAIPYQTLNTMFFTNMPSGVMSGDPGFRFDFFTNNVRLPMDTWVNRGSISAETFVFTSTLFSFGGPWLLVSATNIINTGPLNTSAQGLIRLQGNSVDVRRTGLRTGDPIGVPIFFGGGIVNGTNYINDVGITDLYWGAGTNNTLDGKGPPMPLPIINTNIFGTNIFFGRPNFSLPFPASPFHQVIQASTLSSFFFTNQVSVPSFLSLAQNYSAVAYSNSISATSAVIQVVFTPTNFFDTNLTVDVTFVPTFLNGAAEAVVQYNLVDFDIVTRQYTTNSVFLLDTLAQQTNVVLYRNFNAPAFRRPNNYQLGRGSAFFFTGFGTNNIIPFSPELISNPAYASNSVQMLYAGYSASVIPPGQTNILGTVPALSDPTNFPGRVEILGDKVNLDQTRIRSESTIIIRAGDLSSNKLAQVEAPFLIYDLTSKQPEIVITNLAPPFVRRLSGTLSAWSGLWRNYLQATNTVTGTNGQPMIVTNRTEILFHVLIVDPSFQSLQPVDIREFKLHGTNVVIADTVNVGGKFLLDAKSVHVTGGLNLPFGVSWAASNVLNLVNFTNDGTINISGAAFMGADQVKPLSNYVNHGSISAAAHFIRSRFFESAGSNLLATSGTILANGGVLSVDALDARTVFGRLLSSSDVQISANNLFVRESLFEAGSNTLGTLVLSVTNSLTDSGPLANNVWKTTAGVDVTRLPATGDLIGTRLESTAPLFSEARHIWPAQDLGADPAGYVNNLALGRLVLDGGDFTLFTFAPANGVNALYVDYLELRNNATNYNSALSIEPGMTIYFADANIPPEKLDGRMGGRLRWVSGFIGPQSSTNILYPNGITYTFNAGVVRSKDLDSDNDGIVNADDPTPLPVPGFVSLSINTTNMPPMMALLSWDAVTEATNCIEYKDNLSDPIWKLLTNVVQGSASSRISVLDLLHNNPSRIYRIRVEPQTP